MMLTGVVEVLFKCEEDVVCLVQMDECCDVSRW